MKKIVLATVLFVMMSVPAFAADIFAELGVGFGKSLNSEAAIIRYRIDSPQFFDHDSFYEAVLMTWNGEAKASSVGIAKTIRWHMPRNKYFDFSLGGMYIDKDSTENLGTQLEFYLRFSYVMKIHNHETSFSLIHLSNGSGTIAGKYSDRNNGENFLTISTEVF